MSDTESIRGEMAMLKTPLTKAQREQVMDALWDDGVHINYEGTLIYTRCKVDLVFGDFIFDDAPLSLSLQKLAKAHGLRVNRSTIRRFSCTWYNGGDCPCDELKLDQFTASPH